MINQETTRMKATFQYLWTRWPWRPIRNCPGRFILPWTEQPISFEVLLDSSCIPQAFSSPAAKDQVLVVPLEEGGLISYQPPDGRLIHTLNTPEGFSRKLRQLQISLVMATAIEEHSSDTHSHKK
jgi:hypothetical protein